MFRLKKLEHLNNKSCLDKQKNIDFYKIFKIILLKRVRLAKLELFSCSKALNLVEKHRFCVEQHYLCTFLKNYLLFQSLLQKLSYLFYEEILSTYQCYQRPKYFVLCIQSSDNFSKYYEIYKTESALTTKEFLENINVVKSCQNIKNLNVTYLTNQNQIPRYNIPKLNNNVNNTTKREIIYVTDQEVIHPETNSSINLKNPNFTKTKFDLKTEIDQNKQDESNFSNNLPNNKCNTFTNNNLQLKKPDNVTNNNIKNNKLPLNQKSIHFSNVEPQNNSNDDKNQEILSSDCKTQNLNQNTNLSNLSTNKLPISKQDNSNSIENNKVNNHLPIYSCTKHDKNYVYVSSTLNQSLKDSNTSPDHDSNKNAKKFVNNLIPNLSNSEIVYRSTNHPEFLIQNFDSCIELNDNNISQNQLPTSYFYRNNMNNINTNNNFKKDINNKANYHCRKTLSASEAYKQSLEK